MLVGELKRSYSLTNDERSYLLPFLEVYMIQYGMIYALSRMLMGNDLHSVISDLCSRRAWSVERSPTLIRFCEENGVGRVGSMGIFFSNADYDLLEKFISGEPTREKMQDQKPVTESES